MNYHRFRAQLISLMVALNGIRSRTKPNPCIGSLGPCPGELPDRSVPYLLGITLPFAMRHEMLSGDIYFSPVIASKMLGKSVFSVQLYGDRLLG